MANLTGLANLSNLTNEEQAIEWYKCKKNPFYFIYNYVIICSRSNIGIPNWVY